MVCLNEEHAVDVKRWHLTMSVAHKDEIDTGYLPRNRDGLVFIRHLPGIDLTRAYIFLQTHVHRYHHDICALLFA